MKKKFLGLILSFVILLVTGCKSHDDRLHATMEKSIAWLWAQQDEDGGWHSQTHAVLKDGKALTPYILFHLLQIPEDKFIRPEGGVERGVEFIQREIRGSMSMSADSLPMLNYPNYSAAYALKVLCFLKQDTALQNILTRHLLREQFIEHRGITPDNLAYGGWGYGEPGLPFGEHGHVDVSHTRRIIEALVSYSNSNCVSASLRENIKAKAEIKAEAKAEAEQTITPLLPSDAEALFAKASPSDAEALFAKASFSLTCAQIFLQGVQRAPEDPRLYEGCLSRKDLPYDGGFISSSVTLATNKCEPILIEGVGYHYPSYATATCDGLLALHALGMTDTKAYADAKLWLEKHQDMSTIDGLSKDDPEQWHEVMHYYHWAVRAEAMTAAGITGPWSKELERLLVKEQQPDGYYINPIGGVNKEDDPLMATIFALQAGIQVKSEE